MSSAHIEVIEDPAVMATWSEAARARGQRVALVPTLGYLHAGHVALLQEARRRGDRVALSIFVNPTQFAPHEDLARYPRDLPGDLEKATAAGADVAFVPPVAAMYPPGHQTSVEVLELQKGLCGERRPGHFVGVATVVLKLFNIARPHVAIFGDKDFQQLAVIRRMVRDLDVPVGIVDVPTVREPDGLAMSSRNSYLTRDERTRATALHRGLEATRALHAAGERSAVALLAAASNEFTAAIDRLDYLALCDAETLTPVATVQGPVVVLVAAFVGKTRLIDNVRLG